MSYFPGGNSSLIDQLLTKYPIKVAGGYLKRNRVTGDGNCLLHCYAQHLASVGITTNVHTLRRFVIESFCKRLLGCTYDELFIPSIHSGKKLKSGDKYSKFLLRWWLFSRDQVDKKLAQKEEDKYTELRRYLVSRSKNGIFMDDKIVASALCVEMGISSSIYRLAKKPTSRIGESEESEISLVVTITAPTKEPNHVYIIYYSNHFDLLVPTKEKSTLEWKEMGLSNYENLKPVKKSVILEGFVKPSIKVTEAPLGKRMPFKRYYLYCSDIRSTDSSSTYKTTPIKFSKVMLKCGEFSRYPMSWKYGLIENFIMHFFKLETPHRGAEYYTIRTDGTEPVVGPGEELVVFTLWMSKTTQRIFLDKIWEEGDVNEILEANRLTVGFLLIRMKAGLSKVHLLRFLNDNYNQIVERIYFEK